MVHRWVSDHRVNHPSHPSRETSQDAASSGTSTGLHISDPRALTPPPDSRQTPSQTPTADIALQESGGYSDTGEVCKGEIVSTAAYPAFQLFAQHPLFEEVCSM